jgi:hypothetical protein
MIDILNAALWRMGGSGMKPFRKNWRRFGWPMLLLAWCLTHGVNVWIAILAAILAHGTTRLSLTFFGDSLREHWFNWLWIWIAGYAIGLPSVLLHGWIGFVYALIPCVTQGLGVTLSNIAGDPAETFVHPWVEAVVGVAVAQAVIR